MANSLLTFQVPCVDKLSTVKNSLCADDMGLGKTVEAIAIDLKKRAENTDFKGKPTTLIVAPWSVIGGWEEHLADWAPDLKVVTIDRKNRTPFIDAALKGKGDVFLCHWDSLRLMKELRKRYFFHIIADEVHRAKNRDAQQTQALKALSTYHKLGLSGTPADNRPDDLWSILNWLYPKTYSSYWQFCRKHVKVRVHNMGACMADDCTAYHKRAYREILGCADVQELHRAMKSFYVRRTKDQVWKDMPEKYWTTIWVDLEPVQRRAYNDIAKNMLAWVGANEDQPIATPLVISKLMRLQQFACAYGKMVLVTKRVKCANYVECPNYPDGPCDKKFHEVIDEKLQLTDPSSKLDAAMDLVLDNPDKPMVFFGQSKQVINLFGSRLAKVGVPHVLLTGDTKDDRKQIVRDFQAGKYQIFAGTIAAGGEGITLTRSSTVVFFDRMWSPSKNRQAEDRCHRIGQKNAVQVIDIVARNTIEPDRNTKIEWKWSILKEMLGDIK